MRAGRKRKGDKRKEGRQAKGSETREKKGEGSDGGERGVMGGRGE